MVDAPGQHRLYRHGMLCSLYIEALLADRFLADFVWELWDQTEISDEVAVFFWQLIAARARHAPMLCLVMPEFARFSSKPIQD